MMIDTTDWRSIPMPDMVVTSGANLVLLVVDDGWQLVAPDLTPALAAHTLRTLAKALHPGKTHLAKDLRGRLWDVLTELMEAVESAKTEPGPMRRSTDDTNTAANHLRAVIETL